MSMRIKKGDTVAVVSGDDRGTRGKVLRVVPKDGRVVVESVNVIKKHQRPVRAGRGQVQPGIIKFEAPINLSNVMLVCPHCNAPTRVGLSRQADGSKVRVCKKCKRTI